MPLQRMQTLHQKMYATYICIKEFPFTCTMVVENLCLLNSCNLFALKNIKEQLQTTLVKRPSIKKAIPTM